MKVTEHTLLADVFKEHPSSLKIFFKYFAGACFSCPSFQMETIEEAALRHGADAGKIVKEINELSKKEAA